MRFWPFSSGRKVSTPRLRELDERLVDVEKAIEWLKAADKQLNARIATIGRKKSLEDPASETIETPPTPQHLVFPRDRSRRGF